MKQISRRWRFHEGHWSILVAAVGGMILCAYVAEARQGRLRRA